LTAAPVPHERRRTQNVVTLGYFDQTNPYSLFRPDFA